MSGPVPARVDGTAKVALLSLIDDAVDAGWTLNRACAVVELDRGRAWRWQQRRAGGGLDDALWVPKTRSWALTCNDAS